MDQEVGYLLHFDSLGHFNRCLRDHCRRWLLHSGCSLDSAIAPFVTKGVVELFAYHEIQKVARELARRYQDGLLSVMKEQEKRYEACLDSLLTAKEVVEGLREGGNQSVGAGA